MTHKLMLIPISAVKSTPSAKTPTPERENLSPLSWQVGDLEWTEVNRKVCLSYKGRWVWDAILQVSELALALVISARCSPVTSGSCSLRRLQRSPHIPHEMQVSWLSLSVQLTHTSYERLKGTHVLPLHMKRVCKLFQCLFFYTRGKEIKLSQTVFQDLRKRAQGYFAPCLG